MIKYKMTMTRLEPEMAKQERHDAIRLEGIDPTAKPNVNDFLQCYFIAPNDEMAHAFGASLKEMYYGMQMVPSFLYGWTESIEPIEEVRLDS